MTTEMQALIAQLQALIAKLETATGYSYDLDREIAQLLSVGDREYTDLLDAALRLVPETAGGRWPWCVLYPAYKVTGQVGGMGTFQYMDGKAYGGVRNPIMSHLGYDHEGYGATPAIALCIAAITARMAHLGWSAPAPEEI